MTTQKELLLLDRVAAYIYGPRWQRDLARDLKLNERTVRAWIGGRNTVNPKVWLKLDEKLSKKIERAPIMIGQVRKQIQKNGA